jgi:hypothetical protein
MVSCVPTFVTINNNSLWYHLHSLIQKVCLGRELNKMREGGTASSIGFF